MWILKNPWIKYIRTKGCRYYIWPQTAVGYLCHFMMCGWQSGCIIKTTNTYSVTENIDFPSSLSQMRVIPDYWLFIYTHLSRTKKLCGTFFYNSPNNMALGMGWSLSEDNITPAEGKRTGCSLTLAQSDTCQSQCKWHPRSTRNWIPYFLSSPFSNGKVQSCWSHELSWSDVISNKRSQREMILT